MADYPDRLFVRGSIHDHPRSPVITRHNTATAEQILSMRPGYVIALLIHMKGMQNAEPCDNCRAAYDGRSPFPHYVGCISLFGFQGGACSNCVWPRSASYCSHHDQYPPEHVNPSYDDLSNLGLYTSNPASQVPRNQTMPGGQMGTQLRTRLALPAPASRSSPEPPARGSVSPRG
jgi:hypothetical protein